MFQGSNKQNVRRGAIENRDEFAKAPPGISLTTDNSKWPWGNPPEEVDVDVILEKATDKLDSDPVFKEEMMKLLLAGVSVEHIVETWLIDGFENGRFSLDSGLLAKGPLGVYIAYLADKDGIPYRMFEKENAEKTSRMDDASYFELMRTNNPAMFQKIREASNRALRNGLDSYAKYTKENIGPVEDVEEMELEPSEGFVRQDVEEV